MLNDRQLTLYQYLQDQGDQWSKQEDIAYALYCWYGFTEDNFHDSRARSIMTMDIRAINENTEIQKIIISSPNGIKLANEAEFDRYIKSEYKSIFNKLKRIRIKERKGQLDGQKCFVFKEERDIIEAFLHEAK